MVQVSGPAAINGFLYQILHHLGWISEVSLSGTLDRADIRDARLILEPIKGGDARAEASGIYLVEQYKTRKDGTWAVADIISVFGNLRKAVPSSQPANACYRFVTDGRQGRLARLRRLEHFRTPKWLRLLRPTPKGRHYSGIGGTGPAAILGGG